MTAALAAAYQRGYTAGISGGKPCLTLVSAAAIADAHGAPLTADAADRLAERYRAGYWRARSE